MPLLSSLFSVNVVWMWCNPHRESEPTPHLSAKDLGLGGIEPTEALLLVVETGPVGAAPRWSSSGLAAEAAHHSSNQAHGATRQAFSSFCSGTLAWPTEKLRWVPIAAHQAHQRARPRF